MISRYMIAKLLLFCSVLALSAGFLRAENWPCWRGPRGDGTSLEPGVPTHWSATSNVVWKAEVPGEGHSSPIVWGDRLFLTTALKETQERVLLSLHRKTGKLLWQQTVLRAQIGRAHV
jgi:outer membrane protein assembly factor BamB